MWSKYTEDFDPLIHDAARLPDIGNFLLAIGSRLSEQGVWRAVSQFKFGPQAEDFKFVVRKKSEKEFRFKLVKQETAASLAQQVELGAMIGPFGKETAAGGRKAKPRKVEMEKFVGELCDEAVVEEDAKLVGAERDIMAELLEDMSDDEPYF